MASSSSNPSKVDEVISPECAVNNQCEIFNTCILSVKGFVDTQVAIATHLDAEKKRDILTMLDHAHSCLPLNYKVYYAPTIRTILSEVSDINETYLKLTERKGVVYNKLWNMLSDIHPVLYPQQC